MPPAVPVPELIAAEIVSRLEAITILGGYEFNVGDVVRPNRQGTNFVVRSLTMLVVLGDMRRNYDLGHEGNPPANAYDLDINLHMIGDVSTASSGSYQTKPNDMAAAAIKAISQEAADPSMWYTMAGNSIHSEITSIENYSSFAGDHSGAVVILTTTFRVSETDPFTVRA